MQFALDLAFKEKVGITPVAHLVLVVKGMSGYHMLQVMKICMKQ